MTTWPLERMDQLCEITSSKRIFAADYVSEGVPFYRGREITEKYKGNLDVSTELFITEDRFREIVRKFGAPKQGDLLLTSVGTLGSVYVVKLGDRFYFKDGNLTWFRHFKGLDSQFLYYWIGSPQGKAELQKCTIGSSQSAFTIVLLKSMEIELPPLPVQQRIAGILSAYDELIENSQRRIRILESMARALYREWFVHFRFPGHGIRPLGENPQGVQAVPLSSLVDFAKGRKPAETRAEPNLGDVKLLLIDSLHGGTPVFTSPSKLVLAEARDTIMVMDGASSCEVTIGSSGAVGSTLGRFRTTRPDIFSPHALFRFLEDKAEEFKGKNIGAAIPHANKDYILTQTITLPSRTIASTFHLHLEPIQQAIDTLKVQIRNLRRTRDVLLPRLLSGQIDLETA